jgi:hypothetical protein
LPLFWRQGRHFEKKARGTKARSRLRGLLAEGDFDPDTRPARKSSAFASCLRNLCAFPKKMTGLRPGRKKALDAEKVRRLAFDPASA